MEPLEDSPEDVLKKAFLNAGLTPGNLPCNRAEADRFLKDHLYLDPARYHSMPDALPALPLPQGLKRHKMPFRDWSLNIWTLQTDKALFVIDTGLGNDQLPEVLASAQPSAILITHLHPDHVGGISSYPKVPVWDANSCPSFPVSMSICGRQWTAYNLNGHTDDSVGWVTQIEGKTILFSGDALFACSIGKCPGKRALALHNLTTTLRALPPDTIVCPGHGPVTTIAYEWSHNPFLPYGDTIS
jgi:glyoxylase-like metal-dependent hydrolase (beta-lactamase superfamily II)